MPKQEILPLRKQPGGLAAHEGAHANLVETAADFPVALRGAGPLDAHTAWQLLEHMRTGDAILNIARDSFPDHYWPPTEAPPGNDAWEKSIQQFRDT